MSDDDDDAYWEDDDNEDDSYYLPNEFICEIGFFEYEHSNSQENDFGSISDREYFMRDHLSYCLGSPVLHQNQLYHLTSILPLTFYQFPYHHVLSYLKWYTYEQVDSFTFVKPPNEIKLHILQIFIKPISPEETVFQFESTVVIKTIWLSLVQRHWKKILMNRKDILFKMKTFAFLAKREKSFKYIPPSFPTLKGMLSCYRSKSI